MPQNATGETVLVVLGTRPEAIKLAPVVHALRRGGVPTLLVSTAQHREMLDQVLGLFELRPDRDLDLMRPNQSLNGLAARVLEGIDDLLLEAAPRLVIVQGDTTTTMATSLAAFHRRIPLGHVEAGLRSFDLENPYPEEMNRRVTSLVTALHFAPTPLAAERLLAEGVDAKSVLVTGNTVVDALHVMVKAADARAGSRRVLVPPEARMILVTSHRRESWGPQLQDVCLALCDLVDRFPDVHVVYPVHLNPNVRHTVEEVLADRERIHLLPPVDYLEFIQLMKESHLILTDSGGVQEEAPSLGKPLLLMRKVTERPEAFEAGVAKIVGTERSAIVREATRLLEDSAAYRSMARSASPYGDGRAADRITRAVRRWLEGVTPLLEDDQQFLPRVEEARAWKP